MPDSDRPSSPPIVSASRGVDPGLSGVWVSALATVIVLAMLVLLLGIVTVNAFSWFWPARVLEVHLTDGRVVVGELVGREQVPAVDGDDRSVEQRIKLKVGNREVFDQDFMWIDEASLAARSTPEDLVRVVRREYGDAFGRIVAATDRAGRPLEIATQGVIDRLLWDGAELRRQRGRLERRLEKIRRPLTRAEERLDVVERSSRAGAGEMAGEIEALEREVNRLAEAIEEELGAVQLELDEAAAVLHRSTLTLRSGAHTVEVPLAGVVDVVWSNRLGPSGRVARAIRSGVLFLFSEPREANTEGGIFPALFGTVLLVLLMSLAVVPLGVITAVYMTDYARPGILLRLANQAVNNLAGVPSIVFGMFGLAFFIYGVGGAVDRTLFADRLPTPTFGTGGLLWAALTLALLTVPVVVVATREGLLAVPRSWRDGSLALGATRWQTLRRIVLPAAMPGILTGLILAVSRAAGEVAPLMLTGAVKLAPSLPVDGVPPFLHLQRKFMHLGFHIYDVSMQSPNVEAAKPMAFATTLVLLALVALMNLTAIIVRRRLRRAYRGHVV